MGISLRGHTCPELPLWKFIFAWGTLHCNSAGLLLWELYSNDHSKRRYDVHSVSHCLTQYRPNAPFQWPPQYPICGRHCIVIYYFKTGQRISENIEKSCPHWRARVGTLTLPLSTMKVNVRKQMLVDCKYILEVLWFMETTAPRLHSCVQSKRWTHYIYIRRVKAYQVLRKFNWCPARIPRGILTRKLSSWNTLGMYHEDRCKGKQNSLVFSIALMCCNDNEAVLLW